MSLIEARGVGKSYGDHEVLRGIDLDVAEGEIVGILGANGAGKTTLVEIIAGLRTLDSGTVRVAGLDPQADERALRQILGMQLQQTQLPARTTPREVLDLFASFYDDPQPTDQLLESFGLTAQAAQHVGTLSGGQQQRLAVALALVGRPRIAILDELTTGLDPAARRDIWTYLDDLAGQGTTMLLVTHSMEEAAHLCDRVCILVDGRIAQEGAPADLAASAGAEHFSFVPSHPARLPDLENLPGVESVTVEDGTVTVTGSSVALQTVLTALSGEGITAERLRVTTPTLDDAYLRATREVRHG